MIEFDVKVGFASRPRRQQRAVDDAAVLHVRRQQAQRHLAHLLPGHLIAVPELLSGAVIRR